MDVNHYEKGDFATVVVKGEDKDSLDYCEVTYVGIISYNDENDLGFRKATSISFYPNVGKQYKSKLLTFFHIKKNKLN